MKSFTRSLCALALILTAGCQSYAGGYGGADYRVPVGTRLVVNRDIEVPANWARVFLQDGRIVSYGDIGIYYPLCELELRRVMEVAQTVRADTFLVDRVRRGTKYVVQREPIRLAGGFGVRGIFGVNDGGPSHIMETVELHLVSDSQPDVFRLVCGGGFDNPALARPPSLEQMRAALGEIASLQLP